MIEKNKANKEDLVSFKFSEDNLLLAKKYMSRYPKDQKPSATLPLLYIAQDQEGFVSDNAIKYISKLIDVPPIKIMEVASFHNMIHLKPVGKYQIKICTTTPCWLRGSDELVEKCEDKLGIKENETTKDGTFSLTKSECLGACVNAPMVQINNDYYEDLCPSRFDEILDDLSKDKLVKFGSQIDEQ